MELKEFKDYIENTEKGKQFDYGISEPFSWRGSYGEVAFTILEQPMTREEILANIKKAYEGIFYGYKGGEYTYQDYTEVHFEEDISRATGGGYCGEMIAKIEGGEIYESQEDRLVKLAFSAKHQKRKMEGQKHSNHKPPIFTYISQFKHAMAVLSARMEYGHRKYIDTDADYQNFARVPNPDFEYSNAMIRHALELFGDESELGHKAATAWDAVARLEVAIREDGRSLEEIVSETLEGK